MNTRPLLIGIAAATLLAAPALAAPPAANTGQVTVTAPATSAPAAAKPAVAKTVMNKTEKQHTLYKAAQEKLKGMNLYSGPVDGQRNATFVKSVESFQKAHKLKATGLLSNETQKALGI